jgi:hypothetical protein
MDLRAFKRRGPGGVQFEKKEDDKNPAATAQRPTATVRYLDRPDCLETFADSITGLSFDGQMLRLEFAVTRMATSSRMRRSAAAATRSAAWCCSRLRQRT